LIGCLIGPAIVWIDNNPHRRLGEGTMLVWIFVVIGLVAKFVLLA
jgi:hypothetical protein